MTKEEKFLQLLYRTDEIRKIMINDVEVYVLDIIKNAIVCSAGKRVLLIDTAEVEEVQIDLIKE